MAKSNRERQKLKDRYANAKEIASREAQGFEMSTVNLPKGTELFTFKKEGRYRLDIIPYVVGKGNPQAKEGLIYYKRRYYVHKNVGAANKWIVCPARTLGKRCPICEDIITKQREGADKETISALRDKIRELWLVRDHDDLARGVQLYEAPYSNGLGELLTTELEAMDEDDADRDFFHLEDGRTLQIHVKEETAGTGKFKKPVSLKFLSRKEPLPEDLLDEVPCLDEIIREVSYDELRKLYLQLGDDEDEESEDETEDQDEDQDESEDDDESDDEEPRSKKQSTAKELGLKVGSLVIYNGDKCKVTKISSDGTSLTLEDTDDGEVHKMVAPGKVNLSKGKKDEEEEDTEDSDDSDDEDESPLDEEEESEDDDSDDDEPPTRKGGQSKRR